jgi:excinuclease UvrABC ATPase subunit
MDSQVIDKQIIIEGAEMHNLKNIDLSIPKKKLVVVTGLSGSGKSSLAFDTIYAEGQRRFIESLSSYTRQFLGKLTKPKIKKNVVFRLQLQLSSELTIQILDQQSELALKFMNILNYSMLESVKPYHH